MSSKHSMDTKAKSLRQRRAARPPHAPLKKEIRAPRQIGLLVLGMHRSGTSALTRTLNLLGAALPNELLGPSVNNPMGHWESTRLYELHNELLQQIDTQWDGWLPIEEDWFHSPVAAFNANKLAAFVTEEFTGKPLFVLKDPRLCRIAPLWRDVFEIAQADLRVVIPFRNPIEVAASLELRNDMAPSNAMLVWLRHVLDAEAASRGLPRSFVRYDALLEDWRGAIDRIGMQLGLKWPRRTLAAERDIDAFLRPDQRHHATSDDAVKSRHDVPEWVTGAYDAILRLADDPSSRVPGKARAVIMTEPV